MNGCTEFIRKRFKNKLKKYNKNKQILKKELKLIGI